MIKKISILSIVTLFLASCGGSTTEEDLNLLEDRMEEMMDENSSTVGDSPCDLISSDEIVSLFGIPSEFEVVQAEKDYTYPTCTFKWKDGKVYQEMKIGNQEIKTEIDSEVLIVMVEKSNKKMFDQATKVYKDGIEVNGVGDNAIWGGEMSQLTFLSGDYIFHVNVKARNFSDKNKAKAIEIAKLLISKI